MTTRFPARGRRLVFAQTLDAVTFLAFYLIAGSSVHAERNPIILVLMALGGIWLVVAAKIALAGHIAYRLGRPVKPNRFWILRTIHPYVTVFMVSLGVAAGIVGAGFNVASLIDSIR